MGYIKDIYNGNINMTNILGIFKLLLLYIVLPLLILYYIIFMISLMKIFEKEGINRYYAFIPFYNLALLLKIIGMNSIYAYMPILNILLFIFVPYNLCKQYGLKDNMSTLAIIFPYVLLPYVAFNNFENRDKEVSFSYIKTTNQIDDIEEQFNQLNNGISIIDDHDYISVNQGKQESTLKESFVDKIDYSNVDEFVENEDLTPFEQQVKPVQKDEEEIIDLEDEDNIVNVSDIDLIDKEVVESSESNIKIEQDIKDYKKEGPSVTAIAFGGTKEEENKTEAKQDKDKCPRCGAPLAGTTDRCLGCGLELK
ncbi:MAG: hypothetical protein IKP76_01085 [Bacilli bacterium]|nr:hypothetical protein [Bacilli bacterium]